MHDGATCVCGARDNRRCLARVPAQVGALPRLRELTLLYCDVRTFAPLTHLTALTSVAIEGSLAVVPAELSRLTSLRSLAIELDDAPEELDRGPLPAALPHLRRLTYLSVAGDVRIPEPPAALACLTGLRSLQWAPRQSSAHAALPPGAWLADLTRLEARCELLAASLPALAAATQLQELLVARHTGPPNGTAVERVARWAAGAASLRSIVFNGTLQLPRAGWPALLWLKGLRPQLRIET